MTLVGLAAVVVRRLPGWPLWFAAVCFVHVTRAGAALVLGLLTYKPQYALGVGSALPGRMVTNAELAETVDTTEVESTERSGARATAARPARSGR